MPVAAMPLSGGTQDGDVLQRIELVVLELLSTCSLLVCARGRESTCFDTGIITYDRSRSKMCCVGPRRMAHLLRVLEHVYMLKKTGTHATKRDIYYMDTVLFETQASVDKAIDDLACTLQVTRGTLNINATSKGLVAGQLTYRTEGADDLHDVAAHPRGEAISSQRAFGFCTTASAVVVLEKDSCLMRLLDDGAVGKLNCILVTGRGYPCIATRSFLRRLWEETQLPVYLLTDADPHGAQIALTYAFGSFSLSHENPDLALPALQWAGVSLEDCRLHHLPDQVYLDCTPDDLAKARSLLSHPCLRHGGGGGGGAWHPRISAFLEVKKKAEIQALQAHGLAFLTDTFLPAKMGLQGGARRGLCA
eukprot:TRINITY_DN5450_c0_g2_i1.p1 TRINITY_DN5450_c0_g2~~TRINITY_DN5450_c0_g2_i1.p1  ORF type:complete len:363 (+),score=116.40 TRINITY_DN5450_c0_g2_i1:112-1200(+)